MSISLSDLLREVELRVPAQKCNLLRALVEIAQNRGMQLVGRQEFIYLVRKIFGADLPALRQACRAAQQLEEEDHAKVHSAAKVLMSLAY